MTPCQHCGQPHAPGTPACPRTGDSMSAPGPIGTRLDRYELVSLLGAGGFGAVYKAKHVHTEAMVALKVLKRALGADPGMVERFLREARAAAAVGSDHIVRVLDAGTAQDGTPFLALELLEGLDLKDLATQSAPLPPMRVVLLCLQVLEGLEAAHKKGIVHRDMKPANAFVVRKVDDRGTDKDFVKLLDFGISKMHEDGTKSGLTMTGMAMGTPSYMAPEQFFDARSVDARADVYSVAVMMYELLSGRLPIDASSYAELIVKVRTESPAHLAQLAADLPPPLADTVMTGLAKEKEQRWGSAKDFGNALRAAMGMPVPGQAPIPRPGTLGAHKAPVDSRSMMLGATAAPQRATPAPQSAAPLQPQRLQPTPAPQPMRAPTPMPQAPRPPTPAPVQVQQQTPASAQGWVVPQASGQTPQPMNTPGPMHTPAPAVSVQQPQLTPQPVQLMPGQVTQPPTKGGTMKWVAIIGGSLIGLCCLCAGLGSIMDAANKPNQFGEATPPQEAPLVPALPPIPPAPVAKAKPAKLEPLDRTKLDPNGHEIFDSLKLDRGSIDEAKQVLDTMPELPSLAELEQLAKEDGQTPSKTKELIHAAEKLRQLRAHYKSTGTLTQAEANEVMKAYEHLDSM